MAALNAAVTPGSRPGLQWVLATFLSLHDAAHRPWQVLVQPRSRWLEWYGNT